MGDIKYTKDQINMAEHFMSTGHDTNEEQKIINEKQDVDWYIGQIKSKVEANPKKFTKQIVNKELDDFISVYKKKEKKLKELISLYDENKQKYAVVYDSGDTLGKRRAEVFMKQTNSILSTYEKMLDDVKKEIKTYTDVKKRSNKEVF